MGERKKVAFVLSTNYAGSHFLSLLMGSHSRATHVGELHSFRRDRLHGRVCGVCAENAECPLFRGIVPGQYEHIFEQLFGNVKPEVELLVDASKKCNWAERFIAQDTFDWRFVHLIRDPRALVRRWEMGYDTWRKRLRQRWTQIRGQPLRLLGWLTMPPRELYVHKWVRQNRAITRFLARQGLNHRVITYRDLALDTAGEMRELMAWLGLEFEPAQLEYWNVEHHGSRKRSWIKQETKGVIDLRWQEYLPDADKRMIAEHPAVTRYLAEIGMRLTADGLTRHALPPAEA